MPTPRKKRIPKSQRILQEWVATLANEANEDRGSIIHRLARNMSVNGPLVLPTSEIEDTDDEDDIVFGSQLSNTATIKQAPLTVKVPTVKKRYSPAPRLSGATLTLGADPEFLVVKKLGGLDDCHSMERKLSSGGIGFDHSGRCAEFRPNPGMPKDLITNIRDMMCVVRDTKPNRKIVAGGGAEHDMACGGHIHFNIQRLNLTNILETKSDGEDQSLIHALDSFLGRKMLKMNGSKRARPNSTPYGFCGDWREQPHGFEYRTPPSFIGDPVFAEAVFAVAYRIAKLWMENPDVFNDTQGRIAKRREYSILIPTAAEMPTAADRDYWRVQISTFIKMAWDSDFKLNNDDMIERWTAGIPTKSQWRTINFKFPNDETNINMNLSGSITVPIEFKPDVDSIKVVPVPEWQNLNENQILVSKSVYDAFDLRAKRRSIERHGITFIAVEGDEMVIGIPYNVRMQGNRYTDRNLRNFLMGLSMEFDLQIN